MPLREYTFIRKIDRYIKTCTGLNNNWGSRGKCFVSTEHHIIASFSVWRIYVVIYVFMWYNIYSTENKIKIPTVLLFYKTCIDNFVFFLRVFFLWIEILHNYNWRYNITVFFKNYYYYIAQAFAQFYISSLPPFCVT